MKPKKALLAFLAAFAAVSFPLHAATINLDLSSNHAGGFTLDAGGNTFSYTGFSVDYLIVAGGGGGSSTRNNTGRAGGGGGAGGLLEGTTSIAGAQSIVVGAGGAGGAGGASSNAPNGQNSSAFSLTATGGGGGGTNVGTTGNNGGSGGGAPSNGTTGGTGVVGQGNYGASGGTTGANRGGGGGGAGGAGVAGNSGGAGGIGLNRSITGSSLTYATGGNGGSTLAPVSANADAAPANTGNGGLGITPSATNAYNGGAGGSGIVIVRYTGTQQLLSGGLVSTTGGDTVHQFTTTGASTMGFNATIAGNIDGPGDLDWNGGGALTLTGTNTYSGTTSVASGSTLLINGDNSGATGALSIASGGVLGGSGPIGGALTVSGTLSPGNSIGSMTTGGLTMTTGSTYAYEIDPTGIERGDLVAVNGGLNIANNTVNLVLTQLAIGSWVEGDKLTLLSYSGLWDGGLFNYDGDVLPNESTFAFGGMDWTFQYDDDVAGSNFTDDLTGSNFVTMTAIPEPAAALLGGLGMLLLLRRRRA